MIVSSTPSPLTSPNLTLVTDPATETCHNWLPLALRAVSIPGVPAKTSLAPERTLAYVCGPPVMINFVVQDLFMRGFAPDRVISTLERMMQCGVGKCNHCAVGHRYICRDGPVFDFKQIRELHEQ